MKHNSHTNHIFFYAIAITSVVALFKIVSSYGEHNLKASPLISGNYQIKSSNLPPCLKTQNLPLKVEQSGIFLFAKLLNIPLDGRIQDNQLALSGRSSAISECSFSQNTTLNIQGQITDDTLRGEIIWDETTPKTIFTAKREVTKATSEVSH